MKLITKLTLLFILLSTLSLVIVGYITFQNGKETIEQQTNAHLLSIGVLKESEFNRWINDNRRSLRFLAQRPLVRSNVAILTWPDYSSEDSEYKEAFSNLVNDHLVPAIEEDGGFLDLLVVSVSDGRILASTNKGFDNMFGPDQVYSLDGQNQNFEDNPAFQNISGEDHFHFSTPVLDESGVVTAVLVGHADLSAVSSIIAQGSDPTNREDSYLVNANNYFVTNPHQTENYALERVIFTSGVEDCLEGNSDTGVYENYLGVKVIGAYIWMPAYQMCLLTEVDQNVALIPITELRASLIFLGLAISLLVAFLSVLFAQTITQPVRQLVEGVKEIGQGNLDFHINTGSQDELGSLAKSFNKMTANLKLITASRDDLDEEINERKRAEERLVFERDKAQRYLDVSGTIFVVINNESKITLINKAGCKMIGCEEDEILGMDWFESFIPERKRADTRAVFNLILAGDMDPVEYYENPVLTKEGSERIIAWHNALLVDNEGNIQGSLSSGEDITERRRAEDKLRIKDFAFESSLSADSIGNNEGFITHANNSFVKLWGYERAGEVIGKPILDFLEDKEGALEIIESITSTGNWAGEYEALRKDGTTFTALAFANAVNDAMGNQVALYSTVMDITERKLVEQDINKLNRELERRVRLRTEQLEEANSELESFASSVSHDLRAPLRAIDGFSRILVDKYSDNLSPEAHRYLGLVRNNTADMDTLIEDLLAFSRLTSREPSRSSVSPKDIVNLILSEREIEIEKRDLELVVGDLPDCQADPALLKRVFVNLVDNALKFTRDAKPARVKIGHQRLNGELVYFVKDNGVGFDMQYADQLFDVFQRLHRADEFEGTGVGLAIVLRIIRRHGGRVWAEAGVNQGATFFFTLAEKVQNPG